VDNSNPAVALVRSEVPHVWHQVDPIHGAIQVCVALGLDASPEALVGLEETYGGLIVIGPDSGDYSVWGGEALMVSFATFRGRYSALAENWTEGPA
jgi:hypothetical protein